jgi:biopolymer transport protein TolQ
METETLAMAQEADFTLIALFFRATLTVQLVMIALIVASVYVWAITFSKYAMYRRARATCRNSTPPSGRASRSTSFTTRWRRRPSSASERVFVAGMTEWRRSLRDDGALIPGVQQRVDRSMDVAIARESERLTNGLNFLATTGATAPFVGLFGTVWGIMRSFQEIAISGNTSLAVVAPGIAEALLATGLGLLAAIPAVIFYNKLSSDADSLVASYEGFRRRVLDAPVAAARLMGASVAKSDGPRRRRGGAAAGATHVGDQRHALRGRDAVPSDHLHGRRPPDDRGRAHRPARHLRRGAAVRGRRAADRDADARWRR